MTNESRPDPPAAGQIVTFYSYKGGTGRTMAVANVAWILASAGMRVLVVDWDLESPGLHRYLHPFLLDKDLKSSVGLIEMIRDFAAATMEPGRDTDGDWVAERATVLGYATSLEWTFPNNGGIDLLPAGRQDQSYSRSVSTFDWPSFYERLGGGTFIDALGQDMRRHYDYALIDSRTGLSDSASICTVQLPDVVVNCFTLSTQSIDGAVAVARSVRSQRGRRPVRILPVPMRVEDAEQNKLESGRDYARHEFAPFLGDRTADEINRYWGDVEIPYKPFFAYEEILAPFAERPMLENSLLAAFERLTRTLTDGRVVELPAMDERERRRWLLEFERPRPTAASDVVVSYAAVDRMWAEWIAAELGEAGLRVAMYDVDFAAGSNFEPEMERVLGGASRALVLLSHDYAISPQAARFWELVGRRDDGDRPFLVPIRLDSTRPRAPFTDRIPVDLVGASPERARDLLLTALDRPAHPSSGRPADAARRGPRYPAILPPHWSLPPRNSTFTGRGSVLELLRDRLSASVTVVVPQALYGLGGVGKTQVALEYAYRFAANYDLVWWISAEQPQLIRSSLAELGTELHLPRSENMDESVRIVLDALRQGRPVNRWLLIFDNVDEPDDVREFIPQGAGHVLLTSRNQAWNREARAVEIDVFTREESIQFLTRRVPGLDQADAAKVAERLGDLPLAVEQAGAWLTATGMPVERYLDLLDTQLLRMLDENPPAGYDKTTAATWLLSLDRLRRHTPAAAKLLEVCAFFAPEAIPTSLLYSSRFTSVLLPYDPTLRDPILQGRLVREIGRYALATVDSAQTTVQMHRLVQAVVQDSLSPDARADNRRQVQEILAAAGRGDPDRPESWPAYTRLWPHIRRSGASASADPEVRQLVIDMVRYLWKRGDFTSSRDLATETLTLWRADESIGEDPTTLLLGFHLGNTLWSLAAYTKALANDEHTVARLTELVGPDHPYTIMAAGGLAADLRALGRYADARALDETSLTRARDTFGEYHQRTLMIATNVGVSLRMVGDFAAAAAIDEDTLASRRHHFGEQEPNTLLSASNFGNDLRALGRFQESRALLEDTLATYRSVLGNDHVDTLKAAKHLSVTLRKVGEFQAANDLTVDTLRRYLEQVGPDHPDTLSCLMNRACEESTLGDSQAAAATARAVIDGYHRVYSPDHPFLLAGLNNLAIFTRLSGDQVGSQSLIEQAIAGFRATLGDRHPYTASCHINLANAYFELSDYIMALRTDDETWRLLDEVLGPDNPDTLAAAANLVVSRRTAGDLANARALFDDTLARSRRILGDNHPNTVALREGRRLNCDISPPPF
jgi:MinD-like ATPase involved in chromosome partitioning or flagellar assembly/tetratricopeptide (TPR) repeat protein